MDKLAQRRGKIQKLKENLNLGGKLMEKFSPEMQELMDNLRTVDDQIRAIALGEEGNGETLKDLIKVARTNFSRREYMTTISFLGRFHDRLEAIDLEIAKLENGVNNKHYEFLFQDIDPDHMNYLTKDLSNKFEKARQTPTGILSRASLDKTAGLTDWWHNISSDRGKMLSAWEKRFPRYARDLRTQTERMLSKSENLLSFLLSSLKTMSELRNSRKLEEYIKVAKKLQEKFKSYNIMFIQFYNTYVKHFIDYQKTQQAAAVEGLKGMEQENINVMTKPFFDAGSETSPTETLPTRPQKSTVPLQKSVYDRWLERLSPEEKTESGGPRRGMSREERIEFGLISPDDSGPLAYSRPSPINNNPQNDNDTPVPPSVSEPFVESEESAPIFEPEEPTPIFSRPNLNLQNPSIPSPPKMPIIDLPSPNNSSPKIPTLTTLPSPGIPHRKTLPFPPLVPKKSDHTAFLLSLASLEEKSPMLLAKTLIDYATAIQSEDKETSAKLFILAQNVLKG